MRAKLRNDARLREADRMPYDAPSHPEIKPDRRPVLPARRDLPLPSQPNDGLFMGLLVFGLLLVVILYFASIPSSP